MRSPLLAAILFISLIAAGATGLFLLLRGVGHTDPVDALPADTSAFAHADDVPRLLRGLDRTPPGARDRDDALRVPALLSRVLSGRLRAGRGEAVVSPQEIERILVSEAALAVVPDGERDAWALIATFSAADRLIDEALALAPARPDSEDGTWSVRLHHRRRYAVLRPGGLCVSGARGLALLTSSAASMRKILDTIEGRAEPIRTDRHYRLVRDRLRGGDLTLFASESWLQSRIGRPPQDAAVSARAASRTWRLLGSDAVRGAGLSIRLRGGLIVEKFFVALAQEDRGLVGALFSGPPRLRRASLPDRRVPSGFPFYAAASFGDVPGAWRRAPIAISRATGIPRAEVEARLKGFETFLAIDPRRDLVAALGHDVAIGFGAESVYPRGDPDRALLNMPAVLVLGLGDRPAARRLLQRADGLARALDTLHVSRSARGSITTWEIEALRPMRPTYRMTGNHLVLATSPDLLDRDPGTPPPIGQLVEELPGRMHLYIEADTARLLDRLEPAAQAGGIPALLLDRFLSPDGGSRLAPTTAGIRLTEGGLEISAVSPLGGALLLAVSASAGEGPIR